MNTDALNQTMSTKDRLYAHCQDHISGFVFDQSVVNVFPDMIQRSVPGYATIIHMIGQISERYAQSGSRLYDLGCSLGAATMAMRHRVNASDTRIVAIDNAAPMVEQCRTLIAADPSGVPVDVRCEDIVDCDIEDASVCVLNFTLQFVPLSERDDLLGKIALGLRPGGVLIMSEKITFDDKEHNQLMVDLHHNFKRANGYSDLEIAQKRSALENVLVPETLERHRQRLSKAGFRSMDCWFQCFNFTSIIAFK